MQECAAADKWVDVARRLIAIAAEHDGAERPLRDLGAVIMRPMSVAVDESTTVATVAPTVAPALTLAPASDADAAPAARPRRRRSTRSAEDGAAASPTPRRRSPRKPSPQA